VILLLACCNLAAQSTRDVLFFSENVRCYAKLFLPAGFSAASQFPAVVLAPGWGETESTLEKTAQAIAQKGVVAMAIDYRGWGRSGGYLYLAEDVKFDDRLRFSQHTAKVRIRRQRLIPADQIDDIRNAISYIQGEPGVDRARIGVLGKDMAGAHALVIAAIDPRVKAIVAIDPKVGEAPGPLKADFIQERIKLARADSAHATALAKDETEIGVAEYHPFAFLSQIPQAVSVLFLGNKNYPSIKSTTETKPATNVPADAAEWFAKHM
jgi:dienelactone hydrolase